MWRFGRTREEQGAFFIESKKVSYRMHKAHSVRYKNLHINKLNVAIIIFR